MLKKRHSHWKLLVPILLALYACQTNAWADHFAELGTDSDGNQIAMRLDDAQNIGSYFKTTWRFIHPDKSTKEAPNVKETYETYYFDCQKRMGKCVYYSVYNKAGSLLEEGYPTHPHDKWNSFEPDEPIFQFSCRMSKGLAEMSKEKQ